MNEKAVVPQNANWLPSPRRNPQQVTDVIRSLPDDVVEFSYRRRRPVANLDMVSITVMATVATGAAFVWGLLFLVWRVDNVAHFLLLRPAYREIWRDAAWQMTAVFVLVFIFEAVFYLALLAETEQAHVVRRVALASTGAPAPALRQTFRLEVSQRDGKQLNYYQLPDWFTDRELLALADHFGQGGAFERRGLERAGVCSQSDYPELLETFEAAGLLTVRGKRKLPTETFMTLAAQVNG